MIKKSISLLFLLLIIAGCTNKSNGGQNSSTPQSQSQPMPEQKVDSLDMNGEMIDPEQDELAFDFPSIPQTLVNPEERAMYLIEHYWDKCDFHNLDYLEVPEHLEANLANFLALVQSFPVERIKTYMQIPLEKSKGKMLDFFIQQYARYLHDPNSPMMNEEYYIPILEWEANSPKVNSAQQIRAKELLKMALMNRVGQQANDFIYVTPDGSKHHLLPTRAPHTMLVFYVPGCHSCELTIKAIKAEPFWRSIVESGKLKMLFIYAEDDVLSWKNTLNELPDFATVGHNQDQQVLMKPLYDLKASPTIYLLDNTGKVELKDTSLQNIANYLNH